MTLHSSSRKWAVRHFDRFWQPLYSNDKVFRRSKYIGMIILWRSLLWSHSELSCISVEFGDAKSKCKADCLYKMCTDTSALSKHCSLHVRSNPGLPEGISSGTFLLTELEESRRAGRAWSSGAHEDSLRHYVRSPWCRKSPQQCPTEGVW